MRSSLLKRIFEHYANEPSIQLPKLKVNVKVLFLYLPNFTSSQFYEANLKEYDQTKQEESMKDFEKRAEEREMKLQTEYTKMIQNLMQQMELLQSEINQLKAEEKTSHGLSKITKTGNEKLKTAKEEPKTEEKREEKKGG